jgi:hypothetical protein
LHAERNEQRGVKQRQPPRERGAGLERRAMQVWSCDAAVRVLAAVVCLQSNVPIPKFTRARAIL